jgi:hypothetical protein
VADMQCRDRALPAISLLTCAKDSSRAQKGHPEASKTLFGFVKCLEADEAPEREAEIHKFVQQ